MAACILAVAAIWVAAAGPVRAASPQPDMPDMRAAGLSAGPVLAVRSVVDGDTLVLEDGSELRLTGIQAPKLPLGRAGFRAWPLAPEAKAALERIAEGATVRIWEGEAAMDRHGRRLGHGVTDGGVWMQGAMLGAGLARVYTFRDNRALAAEMLALEGKARTAARGIWRLDWYRIRDADELEANEPGASELRRDIDTFQLVEGRVLETARVGGTIYLNFGPDWRTDFTVSARRSATPLFARMADDLISLENARVRVRGWLALRNGPMIEITHPEQIEVLDR